jgi:transposase
MVGRGELTDAAWKQIQPLLPGNGRRGGQWRDHRQVINGIIWKYRTGAPWRDVPAHYGPWQTLHDRLVRWRRDGTWERLLAHAQTKSDAVGELEWVVSVDATISRVHQHAAGARRRPAKAEPLAKGDADRAERPDRGAGAVPRRADLQAAPGRRRQRSAACDRGDRGAAAREHPAWAAA